MNKQVLVDPPDYPDWTMPVSIIAYTIETLPIDISARTIESLKIDIVSEVTKITQTVTVTGAVEVSGTVSISGTVTVTGTVSISGTVTVTGSVTVSGTVSISGTVTVSGTVSISGTVTVSGSVTVSGTVSISGTVEVTGSVTVSGTVAISGTVTVEGSVTVSGTVSIDGTVTITGDVTVSGTVTITGSVTITSGTINIQTSGGANIVIDQLTQAAYLERRSTLQNPALATPPSFWTSHYRGKFFPRGCRGYINTVSIRAQNTGGATADINFAISPYPGAGDVIAFTIPVPAGDDGSVTRSTNIRQFWNYDSMFIYTKTLATAAVGVGYDTQTPPDAKYSEDLVTWITSSTRLFLIVDMQSQTVGDLPVSGTLNVVKLPTTASRVLRSEYLAIGDASEDTIVTFNGAGKVLYAQAISSTALSVVAGWYIRIYCDGAMAAEFYPLSPSADLYPKRAFDQDGTAVFELFIEFEFTRIVEVRVYNDTGAERSYAGEIIVNAIK